MVLRVKAGTEDCHTHKKNKKTSRTESSPHEYQAAMGILRKYTHCYPSRKFGALGRGGGRAALNRPHMWSCHIISLLNITVVFIQSYLRKLVLPAAKKSVLRPSESTLKGSCPLKLKVPQAVANANQILSLQSYGLLEAILLTVNVKSMCPVIG